MGMFDQYTWSDAGNVVTPWPDDELLNFRRKPGFIDTSPERTAADARNAFQTTPSIQSLQSGATYPGDIYAGRAPAPIPSQNPDLSRAADTFGLMGTGSAVRAMTGNVPQGSLGTMGGRMAAGADDAALQKMLDMERQGKYSGDRIRQETGWERGVDNQPKFEMSDAYAEIHPDLEKAMRKAAGQAGTAQLDTKLGDAYYNPPALDAYPFLKDRDLTIQYKPSDPKFAGGRSYEAHPLTGRPTLELRVNDWDHPQYGVKSILAHEIQHPIQELEGFGRGANSKENSGTTFNRMRQEILDDMKKAGTPMSPMKIQEATDLAAIRAYVLREGEVAARNAQTRMDMTPAEIKAIGSRYTQDVPSQNQIVSFSGKKGWKHPSYFDEHSPTLGIWEPGSGLLKPAQPPPLPPWWMQRIKNAMGRP